ncbi:hypothetical protein EV586_104275 [Tumebacillus sp. BK434]|nr:hypothetical protein EV586_104275 [Tumebacillus sp. BK434]
MLVASIIIGTCVLCGGYVLYQAIKGESRYYLLSSSSILMFFGLAATLVLMYLEFPREVIKTVLVGSFILFGILFTSGYIVLYLKSSPSQRVDVRARLWYALKILLTFTGLILAIILLGQLFNLR